MRVRRAPDGRDPAGRRKRQRRPRTCRPSPPSRAGPRVSRPGRIVRPAAWHFCGHRSRRSAGRPGRAAGRSRGHVRSRRDTSTVRARNGVVAIGTRDPGHPSRRRRRRVSPRHSCVPRTAPGVPADSPSGPTRTPGASRMPDATPGAVPGAVAVGPGRRQPLVGRVREPGPRCTTVIGPSPVAGTSAHAERPLAAGPARSVANEGANAFTTTSRPSASSRATNTRLMPPPSSRSSVSAVPSDAWSCCRSASLTGRR